MLKIAIDINDVLRDFTNNFAEVYKHGYDHEYDVTEFEAYTNDLTVLFPFKTPKAYERFVYENYAYELFAAAPACDKDIATVFTEWQGNIEANLDEDIELTVFSTCEAGTTIQSTLFFLSKIGSKVRHYEFPVDSGVLWDKYDVIVTANPLILDRKPKGKISVRIEQTYNEQSKADFSFITATRFFKNMNNTKKIIDKHNKNNA